VVVARVSGRRARPRCRLVSDAGIGHPGSWLGRARVSSGGGLVGAVRSAGARAGGLRARASAHPSGRAVSRGCGAVAAAHRKHASLRAHATVMTLPGRWRSHPCAAGGAGGGRSAGCGRQALVALVELLADAPPGVAPGGFDLDSPRVLGSVNAGEEGMSQGLCKPGAHGAPMPSTQEKKFLFERACPDLPGGGELLGEPPPPLRSAEPPRLRYGRTSVRRQSSATRGESRQRRARARTVAPPSSSAIAATGSAVILARCASRGRGRSGPAWTHTTRSRAHRRRPGCRRSSCRLRPARPGRRTPGAANAGRRRGGAAGAVGRWRGGAVARWRGGAVARRAPDGGRRGGRSRGRQKPRTADRGRPAQTPSNAALGAPPRPSGERLGPEPTESPFGGGSGSSGEKLGMMAPTPAAGAADSAVRQTPAARRIPAAGAADPAARRTGGVGRRHHRDLPGSHRTLGLTTE